MNLFQLGMFKLRSATMSDWKIECDALTDDDWRCLAFIASQTLPPFGSVEGVPRGGLKFAEFLQPYCKKEGGLLIVDDVLTTGASMEALRNKRACFGCVVFARGRCPLWVFPLFKMPESYQDQITAMPFREKDEELLYKIGWDRDDD